MFALDAGTKEPIWGHQDDQCGLPHICRFSRHVRAGDHGDPVFLIVQIGVIGNKHFRGDHLFHHRMPAVPDVDRTLFVDLWPYVLIAFCRKRKRSKGIDLSDGLGRFLDPQNFSGDRIPDFAV